MGAGKGFTTKPGFCRRAVLEEDPESLFDLPSDQLHTRGRGLAVRFVETGKIRGLRVPTIELDEMFYSHVGVRLVFGEEPTQT